MKINTTVSLVAITGAVALFSSLAMAQQKSGDMMDMCKNMMNGKCMDHMKDMGDMKGGTMGMSPSASEPIAGTHTATGVVKSVDAKAGTVTVAHAPVKSLHWPSMTMAFKVEDPGLLDKVAAGKKVAFDFKQDGKDFVITSIK